jgi:putative salt-induced outer membrane protein YdiY
LVGLFEGMIRLKNLRKKHSRSGYDKRNTKIKINELISLYSEISEKSKNYNTNFEKETALNHEENNIKQLKNRFNFCWNDLTEEMQDELVDRLFCIKILPNIVGESLEMFGGRLVRIV